MWITTLWTFLSFHFAGSSTDLSPSVIGYYDRLSGSFNNTALIGELRVKKSPERQSREHSPKPKLIVSKIPTKPTRQLTSNTSLAAPKLNSNHNPSSAKTLQIISPNVHRMISSHQTTTETVTTSPSVKSYIHSLNQTKNPPAKLKEKNSSVPGRRVFLKSSLPKPSSFAAPLSRNLSKISQSNGLVDSSEKIVHTITDNDEINELNDSEKTPTNCDHNFNYDNSLSGNNCTFDDDDDDIQNVLNKTSELINNLLSGGNNSDLSVLDAEAGADNSVSCVSNGESNMKGAKGAQRHKYQLQLNSESDEDAKSKATEENLKLAKSLDNVADGDFKPTSSPKLSYSRAKLLSNQQLKSPTHSPKLSERAAFSSDNKLTASPSSKHRPLSAASISSSSSSTSTASSTNSFGVENLVNGKLIAGTTYLASIESLADHSENEGIASLTMCERAALEIIDSEKSYVEDLGQIIRG